MGENAAEEMAPRRRWPLATTLIVIVLLAAVVVIGLVRAGGPGRAEEMVTEYLDAVVAGEFEAAAALHADTGADGGASPLFDDAIGAATGGGIEQFSVDSVERRGADARTRDVHVSLVQGGQSVRSVLRAVRDDDTWRIDPRGDAEAQPLVSTLSLPGSPAVVVNGVELGATHEDAPLPVFPGSYEIVVDPGSDHLATDPVTVDVLAGFGEGFTAEPAFRLSGSALDEVDALLAQQLEECAAATSVGQGAGCPFGVTRTGDREGSWTITEAPALPRIRHVGRISGMTVTDPIGGTFRFPLTGELRGTAAFTGVDAEGRARTQETDAVRQVEVSVSEDGQLDVEAR